jgi:diguanylate cyclase (GGDEF)-like protein
MLRDGDFQGILVLAIDLERFSNALGGVTELEGVTTVLADLDGRLIMRRPYVEYQPGQVLDSVAHYQGHPPQQAHFLIESPFDGAQRRVAFNRLADWPWLAFVGAERAPVMAASAAFRQSERVRLIISILIISLMIGVIAWLTWLRKRSELALIEDIRERKIVEKQLAWQAHHDPLTRLPNRMLFYDRLQQALQRHDRYRHAFALIYLDLDGFKQVNDRWGHAAGDELLQTVAQRLIEHTRTSDTVARLAGDEFVVLAEQCDREEATQLAGKILTALEAPIVTSGQSLTISASLGIAAAPEDGTEADALIRFADAAMYDAKHRGKAKVESGTD